MRAIAELRRGISFPVARGYVFLPCCIKVLLYQYNTYPTGIATHDSKLQRRLDPMNKVEGTANCGGAMRKDVELIAHSAGALHP